MFEVVKQHAAMQIQYKGEFTAIREMRKHLSWYSSGIRGGAKLRSKINTMETMEDMLATAAEIFCV